MATLGENRRTARRDHRTRHAVADSISVAVLSRPARRSATRWRSRETGGVAQPDPDAFQGIEEAIRGLTTEAGQESVRMLCDEPVWGQRARRKVPEVGGKDDVCFAADRCSDDMAVVGIG